MEDIKGERVAVYAQSVNAVKRALGNCPGIKKVRVAGSDGNKRIIEIIHTLNKDHRWKLTEKIQQFERVWKRF